MGPTGLVPSCIPPGSSLPLGQPSHPMTTPTTTKGCPSQTPASSSYYPCQLPVSAHWEALCLPAHTGHPPASDGSLPWQILLPGYQSPPSGLVPSPQPTVLVGQGTAGEGGPFTAHLSFAGCFSYSMFLFLLLPGPSGHIHQVHNKKRLKGND